MKSCKERFFRFFGKGSYRYWKTGVKRHFKRFFQNFEIFLRPPLVFDFKLGYIGKQCRIMLWVVLSSLRLERPTSRNNIIVNPFYTGENYEFQSP